jgi:hypothetical protein
MTTKKLVLFGTRHWDEIGMPVGAHAALEQEKSADLEIREFARDPAGIEHKLFARSRGSITLVDRRRRNFVIWRFSG